MNDVCIATDDLEVATSLRSLRDDWSLSIATDRRSAQTLLESTDFEVVVLDRRSSWVDDDLIIHVRQTTPDAVRVALVPDAAVADAVRNSRLAHQVLSAQSAPETVANACSRALRVRQTIHDPAIGELLSEAPDLSAPPELWARLSEVLESPAATAKDVAEVVSMDPVVSASVLRLVNSAYFGLSREITELKDAVNLLGFITIRALVLEATSSSIMPSPSVPLLRSAMQKHAVATARVARSIAGSGRSADAFMAGLLMDVGIVLLATTRPEQSRATLALAADTGNPLYVTEREIFGFDHAAAGAALLAMWGMPYTVLEAVSHHHDRPNLAADLSVREALYLARDATQVYGALDPYDTPGALISEEEMSADTPMELIVHAARSIASEIDEH